MKYRVVVSTLAGIELQNIALWLDEQRSGYGIILLNEFDESIAHLSQYPFAQELHHGNYRQVKIGRFQYYLIYEIMANNTIYIYKVLHAKQHPAKKLKKK